MSKLLIASLRTRFHNRASSAQRDKLGCDALCLGSMTSARSALSLVGGVLVGRLSDGVGRKPAVLLGLAGGLAGTAALAVNNGHALRKGVLAGALRGTNLLPDEGVSG